MKLSLGILALGLCCALAGGAVAQGVSEDVAEEMNIAEADGLQVILAQQQELRAMIDRGEGTEGMTKREVGQITRAQDRVFALTEGKTQLNELNIDQKVELENLLEQINAQVKGTRLAGDEQTVCWRERKSGSSLKVTRCGTRAEIREAREGARDFLERPKTCGADCGGQL